MRPAFFLFGLGCLVVASLAPGCGTPPQSASAPPDRPAAPPTPLPAPAHWVHPLLVQAEEVELVALVSDPARRGTAPRRIAAPNAPAPSLLENRAVAGRATTRDRAEIARLAEAFRQVAVLHGPADEEEDFRPRHALRFRRGEAWIEALLCFRCLHAEVTAEAGAGAAESLGVSSLHEKSYDEIFRAHGLNPSAGDGRPGN